MMFSKTLVIIGLLSANVSADMMGLRVSKNDAKAVETTSNSMEHDVEHLDLEVINKEGERELFPLLPGVKCPTGHHCRVRSGTGRAGMAPMVAALKDNLRTPLTMTMDWAELDMNLDTVVRSDKFCTRRAAMTRAAGLAAGVAATTVSQPAYAAETKTVQMGTDSGGLKFVPEKITICKGDSVVWVNNKSGPHNVVFDEDNIPQGVDQEKISMEDQLGEEGDTFEKKFDAAGDYAYYCEPHRGAGMNGLLIVV